MIFLFLYIILYKLLLIKTKMPSLPNESIRDTNDAFIIEQIEKLNLSITIEEIKSFAADFTNPENKIYCDGGGYTSDSDNIDTHLLLCITFAHYLLYDYQKYSGHYIDTIYLCFDDDVFNTFIENPIFLIFCEYEKIHRKGARFCNRVFTLITGMDFLNNNSNTIKLANALGYQIRYI